MRKKRKYNVLIGICMLLMLVPITASSEIITFDELTKTAIDGLNFKNIDFGFQDGTAYYNVYSESILDDTSPAIDAHVLSGSNGGILTLNFFIPISKLKFYFALTDTQEHTDICNIFLYSQVMNGLENSDGSMWTDTASSEVQVTFSEGFYSYSGTQPLSKVVVDFDESQLEAGRFAIDNLEYAKVPLPGAVWILGAGLVGMLGVRRSRRQKRSP